MKTRISALIDGELSPRAAKDAIVTLSRDNGQKSIWNLYHVIGDALRHEPDLAIDVSNRVMAALSLEPTILSPHPLRSASRWQRPLMALAASTAGIAVVAWVALGSVQIPGDSLIASNQKILPRTLSGSVVMVSSAIQSKSTPSHASSSASLSTVTKAGQAARLQEYLVAHQAYAGGALFDNASHIRIVSAVSADR